MKMLIVKKTQRAMTVKNGQWRFWQYDLMNEMIGAAFDDVYNRKSPKRKCEEAREDDTGVG